MLEMTRATLDVAGAVTFCDLPGARFNSERAVHEHGYVASRYEGVVAAYELCGDEPTLWHDLAGLGFNAVEIQWHADNRGRRMEQGYAQGGT